MNLKNTTILDSKDEDELPSLKIALQNITKLSSKDKILCKKVRTQINMNSESPKINIELQNDTTATNSNNDDFTYIINNCSLRISKKKIQSKLKSMVQKLKTKKVLEDIAKICKHKERCKYYNDFKSLSKWQLHSPLAIFQRINHLVPGYYGMKGFIMEDLGVDYDTAVTITHESVKYGNKYFIRDDNDECFWW
ncbi:15993_t:CDS:2 [Gigaspora margarita]|uniref:15993_t:CDS:1 n=1 Tax=Gigaspora margarita TaxID=4874 RepID=A0ABN7UX62_GIGMA|nr:15993_t:CDS:2 [Gigaspora margarita]